MSTPLPLDDALQLARRAGQAEAVLRYHGRTFHFASRLLSARHRRSVARLYAFCRYADDLADRTADPVGAQRILERLRHDLQLRQASSPQAADLLALSDEIGLPLNGAVALLDGALGDLSNPVLNCERDLVRYSYQVAGTVGLMMCSVLDVSDPAARPYAIDLGIAMQLTNIARDVVEDAQAGRIYIPVEWTGVDDATRIVQADQSVRLGLRSGLARLIEMAESYYDSGLSGLHFLPPRARIAVSSAARMYRDIGRRLARNNYDIWSGRTIVPAGRKVWLTATGVAAQALPGAGLPASHQAGLHRDLEGFPGTHPFSP